VTACALFRAPCSIFRTLLQTALGCSELKDKYTAYFSVLNEDKGTEWIEERNKRECRIKVQRK
jgi:hypothetical protein